MSAAIFGVVLLDESVSWITLGGILVLVVGLMTVSTSDGGDIRGWTTRDVMVPVVAAGRVALGTVIGRYARTITDITLLDGIAVNAVGGLVVIAASVGFRARPTWLRASRTASAWFGTAGSS